MTDFPQAWIDAITDGLRATQAQFVADRLVPLVWAAALEEAAQAVAGVTTDRPSWSAYTEGFTDALDLAEQRVREVGARP